MIVNYDHKTFIVQATASVYGKIPLATQPCSGWASGGSEVVDHWNTDPELEGSNPVL